MDSNLPHFQRMTIVLVSPNYTAVIVSPPNYIGSTPPSVCVCMRVRFEAPNTWHWSSRTQHVAATTKLLMLKISKKSAPFTLITHTWNLWASADNCRFGKCEMAISGCSFWSEMNLMCWVGATSQKATSSLNKDIFSSLTPKRLRSTVLQLYNGK